VLARRYKLAVISTSTTICSRDAAATPFPISCARRGAQGYKPDGNAVSYL